MSVATNIGGATKAFTTNTRATNVEAVDTKLTAKERAGANKAVTNKRGG